MEYAWWQRGTVYQIYPRSFQDSNDDGVGDLRGIESRLDYLCWLGVQAVWISPVYPSPMADFGYDVADYTGIDPLFGSLEDFDALVVALHRRGLKLIMDFVPNHTSNLHPWFLSSRRSRTDEKRGWYIWRDPAPDGRAPTNWLSEFGGPAWTFDEPTGQYYYHAYLASQPDLNWREPAVQAALHEVLRFWLKRGVDGFRVDAVHMLIESEALIDNPVNPEWRASQSPARRLLRTHTADLAETQECIAGMRRVVDEYPERVLIGEAYLPISRLMRYYGTDLSGFHLPFNFHLISRPWQPRAIAALVGEYERALPPGGWPNWVLGNHDKSRLASRLGASQTRLAALLLLCLRGTPTLYNGDELGMPDGVIEPAQVQDPWEKNVPGLGLGRDPCRTPMLWANEPGAGFTRAVPWLPITQHLEACNVAAQAADPDSLLSLYRRLLELRRTQSALAVGDYRELAVTDHAFVFERSHAGRRLIVALNFSEASRQVALPPGAVPLLSTGSVTPVPDPSGTATLAPFEGLIVEGSG